MPRRASFRRSRPLSLSRSRRAASRKSSTCSRPPCRSMNRPPPGARPQSLELAPDFPLEPGTRAVGAHLAVGSGSPPPKAQSAIWPHPSLSRATSRPVRRASSRGAPRRAGGRCRRAGQGRLRQETDPDRTGTQGAEHHARRQDPPAAGRRLGGGDRARHLPDGGHPA
ncbi:MAG: hypothetical protein MZV49_16615 [Rhodopseudomonas palustris]|nr:hypothetical protein [Rhodopseudomonas palustris]